MTAHVGDDDVSMRRVTQTQLAITLAAVFSVFHIRLTLLPRSSPFELFLLLNILTAVLFRPPATFAAIASGLVAASVVMLVEDRAPSRAATTTLAYLVLSGILLLLNHRWHRAKDRIESQRIAHAEQRERLLVEAQEANRAKDRLLANVSHELRTPLNAISGWAVILGRTGANSDDTRRGAAVIKRNAEALGRTVDQLLDASLADSGRIRINPTAVSVGVIIAGAVESIAPEAAARGVVIRSLVAPDSGTILADPQRLHQVMLTVLSNAIKFTEPPGHATVEAKNADEFVTIEVTDTGIGIEADYLPSVFNEFSQADPSPTRRYSGVGLGLTLAKQLVELMGGGISVASQGSSRGTVVSLRFRTIRGEPVKAGAGPEVVKTI